MDQVAAQTIIIFDPSPDLIPWYVFLDLCMHSGPVFEQLSKFFVAERVCYLVSDKKLVRRRQTEFYGRGVYLLNPNGRVGASQLCGNVVTHNLVRL
jgi:hypothetical protein